MFAPRCPHCERRVLLTIAAIERLRSAAGRHEVLLRCRCGEPITWLFEAAAPAPDAACC